MAVKWLAQPEDHDYEAAADYLGLIAEAHTVDATVKALKAAEPTFRKAKDILRAARLQLLTETNIRVKGDLARIAAKQKLSPILLVRGHFQTNTALQIADGYHRVCASYLTDENTPIPCRLVSWQLR
jgi:indole-3-glycerol phosphate synthase